MKHHVLRLALAAGLTSLVLQAPLLAAPALAGASVVGPVPHTLVTALAMIELTATGGAAGDGLGSAVALSGDTAVVGASAANSGRGAAYVFVRDNGVWSQQAQLPVSGLNVNAYFGDAVDVSGDTVAVGAPQEDTAGSYSGAVYVYVHSGSSWSPQATLRANDEQPLWHFGDAVAVDGDTLVSASSADNTKGQAAGAVYVFTRTGTTWSQQKLTASDGAAYDNLGASVAVSGDTLIAGAPSHATTAAGAGAAYVFTRSGTTWSQQAELNQTSAATSDSFGTAVAIDGDSAVVGALYRGGRGAGFVFQRSAGLWEQTAELAPTPPTDWQNFGTSVAVDGPVALVGSGATSAAAVYVRFSDGWVPAGSLAATGRWSGDVFGKSVAVQGTTALCGAPGTSAAAGAAWVADVGPRLVRTTVSGVPAWWTRTTPVVATLASESAAGTIVSTEYRPYEQGSWTTYTAPITFTGEGASTWQYRATDSAGNVGEPGFFVVAIDTRPPSTKAPSAAACRHGKKATLKYQVTDPVPGSEGATVTIKVRKGAKIVKTFKLGDQPANKALTAKFTCTLPKGKYTFIVYATDLAGNAQRSAGHNTLTVT